MLDLHRSGVSADEIMERFKMGDRRTLRRHLRLAEVEEGMQGGAERLVQEAVGRHMEEVCNLVESWLGILHKDAFGVAQETLEGCGRLEDDPLFDGLRKHLPFEDLWRDYELWKELLEERLVCAADLVREMRTRGEERIGLPVRSGHSSGARLSPGFARPVLGCLSAELNGGAPQALRCEWRGDGQHGRHALAVLAVNGRRVLTVEDSPKRRAECERGYREVVGECEPSMSRVRDLCRQVRLVGFRLRRRVQRILRQRDFIHYRCDLCPYSPSIAALLARFDQLCP